MLSQSKKKLILLFAEYPLLLDLEIATLHVSNFFYSIWECTVRMPTLLGDVQIFNKTYTTVRWRKYRNARDGLIPTPFFILNLAMING